ncbi:YqjF family protein [Gandjariella thermophila]|uniref:DUF2071 domain-containing protein n=1 Tax=Gandjariella thermophila TaxID=1931992 RepID=A0A4D4J2U2_9PSEU|nr:DUF2071 domain-containing protein [Gandjariella thermophila]GDY28826.1 hypothetical protein GTS_04590 [Gandjariella thermophila]
MDAAAEPITPHPPRPVRRPLLVQQWRDVTFLHWPVDPDAVWPLLPPGARPDTLDGATYVGLVAFRMRHTGLCRGPGLPYLGTFPETNVRVYSVDRQGRRGVVFLSLDAGRLLPVLAGRWGLGLGYRWAAMRLWRSGPRLGYTCRRRGSTVTSRIEIVPGPALAEPSPLEHFLTARWGLHTAWRGRSLYLPNEHPPWPLHAATLDDLDDGLVAATGLPRPTDEPVSVLYSPGVPARFGAPLRVPG